MSGPPPTPFTEAPKRLGEALIGAGRIDEAQLAEALKTQESSGKFIGEILVEMNVLTKDELMPLLIKHCKLPYVSLLDYLVDETLFELVPIPLCKQHRLLPIDKMGKSLTIAMVNPLNTEAIEIVQERNPELRIKPILCDADHYEEVAQRVFADEAQSKKSNTLSMTSLGLSGKKSGETKPAPKPAPKAEAPAEKSDESAAAPASEPAEDKSSSRRALSADLNAAMNDMWGMAQESTNTTYEILARRLRLFRGMSPSEIGNLFALGETIEVDEGTTVFEKGAPGDKLYAVLSGKVRIIDEGKEIAILGSGHTFGEMALVTGEPRSATAISAEKTSLFVMDVNVFRDILTKEGAIRILLNMLGTMSDRLRGSNTLLRSLVR